MRVTKSSVAGVRLEGHESRCRKGEEGQAEGGCGDFCGELFSRKEHHDMLEYRSF